MLHLALGPGFRRGDEWGPAGLSQTNPPLAEEDLVARGDGVEGDGGGVGDVEALHLA
jgi:hypothetical protein